VETRGMCRWFARWLPACTYNRSSKRCTLMLLSYLSDDYPWFPLSFYPKDRAPLIFVRSRAREKFFFNP